MAETNTEIFWPSKLKIGAKSKKDPHVKICGHAVGVLQAREKMLFLLSTKADRVTLKMDVSFTDHSCIIGKGGTKIQQVMKETDCHIHFPDSNRRNPMEKSNQVSITGKVAGVERARCKIRELLPVVFMVQLPATLQLDHVKLAIILKHMQKTFGLTVTFRFSQNQEHRLLIVKGYNEHLPLLHKGISVLMEYLTGNNDTKLTGFLTMEISPQNHDFVKGIGGANINIIMNKTGANIVFPDSGISVLHTTLFAQYCLPNRSSVIISGHFDNVCLAWQEIMKYLPLVLIFELHEGQEPNQVIIHQLVELLKVTIVVRPKTKENISSIMVRGAEKNSRLLFEVRRLIMGLENAEVPICCEKHSASLAPDLLLTAQSWASGHVRIAQNDGKSKTVRDIPGIKDPLEAAKPFLPDMNGQQPISTAAAMAAATFYSALSQILQNPGSVKNSFLPQFSASPTLHPPIMGHQESHEGQFSRSFQQLVGKFSKQSMAPHHLWNYQSDWDGSDDDYDSCTELDDSTRKVSSSFSNSLSSGIKSAFSFPEVESDSGISSLTSSRVHTPVMEMEKDSNEAQYQSSNQGSSTWNGYEYKKFLASSAMKTQLVDGECRLPTDIWSGYGFSKSMPSFYNRDCLTSMPLSASTCAERESCHDINLCLPDILTSTQSVFESNKKEGLPFSSSNFYENLSKQSYPFLHGQVTTLQQLFSLLDLDEYLEPFLVNKIDLPTFLTLTDHDLQDLQIGFSARRKMLSAASCIVKNHISRDSSLLSQTDKGIPYSKPV